MLPSYLFLLFLRFSSLFHSPHCSHFFLLSVFSQSTSFSSLSCVSDGKLPFRVVAEPPELSVFVLRRRDAVACFDQGLAFDGGQKEGQEAKRRLIQKAAREVRWQISRLRTCEAVDVQQPRRPSSSTSQRGENESRRGQRASETDEDRTEGKRRRRDDYSERTRGEGKEAPRLELQSGSVGANKSEREGNRRAEGRSISEGVSLNRPKSVQFLVSSASEGGVAAKALERRSVGEVGGETPLPLFLRAKKDVGRQGGEAGWRSSPSPSLSSSIRRHTATPPSSASVSLRSSPLARWRNSQRRQDSAEEVDERDDDESQRKKRSSFEEGEDDESIATREHTANGRERNSCSSPLSASPFSPVPSLRLRATSSLSLTSTRNFADVLRERRGTKSDRVKKEEASNGLSITEEGAKTTRGAQGISEKAGEIEASSPRTQRTTPFRARCRSSMMGRATLEMRPQLRSVLQNQSRSNSSTANSSLSIRTASSLSLAELEAEKKRNEKLLTPAIAEELRSSPSMVVLSFASSIAVPSLLDQRYLRDTRRRDDTEKRKNKRFGAQA